MVSLRADEVKDLADLYSLASADLLMVRAAGTDPDLRAYLEALTARAYLVLHEGPRWRWSEVWDLLKDGIPRTIREARLYVLVAAAAITLGGVFGMGAVLADQDAFFAIVPAQFADFYQKKQEDPRAARFGEDPDASGSTAFAAYLASNNMRVAVLQLSGGLLLGIPTLVQDFYNGAILGAIAANHRRWGQSLEFWALIIPHGVPELFAFVLASAGGLLLGDGLLRPGETTRTASLRRAAPKTARLGAAALFLLAWAAAVEAYVTPTPLMPELAKIAFGALAAVMIGIWIAAPWSERS